MPFPNPAERRTRSCPMCGGRSPHPIFHNRTQPLGGFDLSYTVVCCESCGGVYADALPDAAVYDAYYRTVSKYDASTSQSALDAQRTRFAVRYTQQFAQPSDRIVDLGCGPGHYLGQLKALGFTRLQGVDPAPQAPEIASRLYGLPGVVSGEVSSAADVVDLARADVVCLWAVLEHLPQLEQDLRGLLQHLRHGTRLLVEVPAVESFDAAHGEVLGEFSPEHIQFFTAQTLVNLMQRLGAEPLDVRVQHWPAIHSGSLFAAFACRTAETNGMPQRCAVGYRQITEYVRVGQERMQQLLAQIPDVAWVLYGAGAHSLRLLANLDDERRAQLQAVLDANPNLQGQQLCGFPVLPPTAVHRFAGCPVVVSSFRAQTPIVQWLRGACSNPLICFYPE